MRHGVFSLAVLILASVPTTSLAGVMPLPPEGASAFSPSGGKQTSTAYLIGSDRGTLSLFYNNGTVSDSFITKSGKTVLDALSRESVTGFSDITADFEGTGKTITIIYNPGGNPNPTTSWSYGIEFNFNEGSSDYVQVDSDFVALDNQVIPGVSRVIGVRNSGISLGQSVNGLMKKFPPPVKVFRNPENPDQALLLPTKPVSAGEITGLVNTFESRNNSANTAFTNLNAIPFDEINEELADIAEDLNAIPDAVAPARVLATTLTNARIGSESLFQSVDQVETTKDQYDASRRDAAKGLLGAVRKVNLLRKAGGRGNRVMRNESAARKRAQFNLIISLIARERGILLTSHQGILFRIR